MPHSLPYHKVVDSLELTVKLQGMHTVLSLSFKYVPGLILCLKGHLLLLLQRCHTHSTAVRAAATTSSTPTLAPADVSMTMFPPLSSAPAMAGLPLSELPTPWILVSIGYVLVGVASPSWIPGYTLVGVASFTGFVESITELCTCNSMALGDYIFSEF